MEQFLNYLESQDGIVVEIDPVRLEVDVTSIDVATNLVVLRDGTSGEATINIAEGARLNLLEVLVSGACSRTTIHQQGGSELHSTLIQLGSSKASYQTLLEGKGADAGINILQLAGGDEVVDAGLRIEHNSANCTSHSLSKAVASGRSKCEFRGLIYVAKDAQVTVADQSSRNVLIGDEAQITADPQLEIYADDVKCSHGATVGQMNQEAIYYMMQRGVSEAQARKLQLEGFARDITLHCAIESLCEPLEELITKRFDSL